MKMAPSLVDAELVHQTACLRPISADGLPIVGQVPGWQNLYVGTGSGRKGILWSTGMCHGLADLVLKGVTEVPGIPALDPGTIFRCIAAKGPPVSRRPLSCRPVRGLFTLPTLFWPPASRLPGVFS